MAEVVSTSASSLGNSEETKAVSNGVVGHSAISVPKLADFYISEKTGFLLEQTLVSEFWWHERRVKAYSRIK
jgi:hypothetical protein